MCYCCVNNVRDAQTDSKTHEHAENIMHPATLRVKNSWQVAGANSERNNQQTYLGVLNARTDGPRGASLDAGVLVLE